MTIALRFLFQSEKLLQLEGQNRSGYARSVTPFVAPYKVHAVDRARVRVLAPARASIVADVDFLTLPARTHFSPDENMSIPCDKTAGTCTRRTCTSCNRIAKRLAKFADLASLETELTVSARRLLQLLFVIGILLCNQALTLRTSRRIPYKSLCG
jgi:hypothetical protein